MKSGERSQAFLRKRKMLLVLPMLVIPFLTMVFWAMGGGKGVSSQPGAVQTHGLNLNLPNANLKEDKQEDKLTFYDKADKDSLKMEEWMRSDPYYKIKDSVQSLDELEEITETTAGKYNQHLNTSPYEGSSSTPDQKIMQKLALLEKEMNKTDPVDAKATTIPVFVPKDEAFPGEVDRLESMLQSLNKGNEGDPEISQLEGTLEKILDVQHPERVKERIKQNSAKNKEQVFPVSKVRFDVPISLMGLDGKPDTTPNRNGKAETAGFYSTDENGGTMDEGDNAIEAVIHETQILVNNSVVKLRLLNDIYINGHLIPKDNFVFGMATLNGERLEIEINSIRYENSLFPVKLQVHDIDGLPGIYIPGAISRDVAKQSTDNSLQLMELSSMDPSFKAQAASAGIGAAKNLISKKVKLIKVTVKAGYKVLLRDGNKQD